MTKNVFTIDVEDWFHILDAEQVPKLSEWDTQSSVVEYNFFRLLDWADEADVKVTCFFLAWVANRYPSLVREAVSRGHEIASHGYFHQLIYDQTPEEFRRDISDAKMLLEDQSGTKVYGYRAPGFSIKNDNLWALETIREVGYEYDSSLFPKKSGHGGYEVAALGPHVLPTNAGDLIEFPISIDSTLGFNICYFGGGYFRLFPYSVIKNRAKKINKTGRPIVFYIHPRDIDPKQPRIDLGRLRNFKCYVNLETTQKKVQNLLSDFDFETISEFIRNHTLKANGQDS